MSSATLPTPLAIEPRKPSLLDLLDDGLHLLALLRTGASPRSAQDFNKRIDGFLQAFSQAARQQGQADDAIEHARYAFCAVLDEFILSSGLPLRADWERMPLQLRLFGEHLAGEGFFERLDRLRLDPADHIDVLEIYLTCLQLGFRGKYLLDDGDRIRYLARTLQQDIERVRGPAGGLTQHWQLPTRTEAPPRAPLPIWLFASVSLAVGIGFFVVYRVLLERRIDALFAG